MLFAIRRDMLFYCRTAAFVAAAFLCLWMAALGNLFMGMLAVPLVLLAAIGLMQLFRGGYYLGDGLLECTVGLQQLLVQYHEIETVTLDGKLQADGFVPFALHRDKVFVYYIREGKAYRLELSPQGRETFIRTLEQKLSGGQED